MSDTRLNRLAVIGLGYVGLPTAAVFASRRVEVIGVDVNERTVGTINSGNVPIDEPELDMLVRAAVGAGMLRATMSNLVKVSLPLFCGLAGPTYPGVYIL